VAPGGWGRLRWDLYNLVGVNAHGDWDGDDDGEGDGEGDGW